MNTKKQFLLLLCFAALETAFAQDKKGKSEPDWQKERIKEMQQLEADQNKEMQDMKDERTKYIERMDAEFSAYLKERWQEFQSFKGVKSSEKPKPVTAPVIEPVAVKPQPRPQEPVLPLPTKPAIKLPAVVVPPVALILPTLKKSDFPAKDINFDYYGTPVRIQYDIHLDAINIEGVAEEEISKVWSEISKTNYSSLVKDLLETRNQLNLNDWGYYQLICHFSDFAFKKDTPKSTIVTWFLLTKSGFKVKLGRSEDQFLLMVSVKQTLYGITYIKVNEVAYYILSHYSSGPLFTYKNDFPEATHIMDMAIADPPVLTFELKQTVIDLGKDKMIVKTNNNLLSFYNDYPQCDLDVYFSSIPSEIFRESIKNFAHGKTGEEALGYLLSFIQHLNYQTDTQQFGKEKFMFPDEFFFFPATDCDDRAIFFAYLSRELLHFNTIGLNYTDHVSTAVAIPEKTSGDYVIYKNIRYTACDPTYVGADIGMTMPKFRKISAIIIVP